MSSSALVHLLMRKMMIELITSPVVVLEHELRIVFPILENLRGDVRRRLYSCSVATIWNIAEAVVSAGKDSVPCIRQIQLHNVNCDIRLENSDVRLKILLRLLQLSVLSLEAVNLRSVLGPFSVKCVSNFEYVRVLRAVPEFAKVSGGSH